MLVGPQPDEDEEEDDEELVDGGSGRRPSLSRAAPAERRRSGPRGGRGCRGGATDGSPGISAWLHPGCRTLRGARFGGPAACVVWASSEGIQAATLRCGHSIRWPFPDLAMCARVRDAECILG